ncbi:MAG TPA: hypothetical protein ENK18_14865 [Deltaproteobacteria bacterium]|nr:hypothetical protein [Deltaproteobacteria bacterium]
MSTYQMLWDCSQCDTQKLLGVDHRFCPACGAPQDPESRYYPSEEDKVHADESNRYSGADLACPSCDTPNAAAAVHCVACGAPMEGGVEVVRRSEQDAETDDSASAARKEHRDARKEAQRERMAAMGGAPPPDEEASGPGRAGLFLGLGLGGLMLAGLGTLVAGVAVVLCLGMFFSSSPTTLVVQSHRWERSVEIEAKKAVTERAWRNEVPPGARSLSCKREVRDTKQVKDGEDCKKVRVDNGNGTFTEKNRCTPRYKEEKIFDDKCSFKIDRWTVTKTERANGTSTKDKISWPKVKLSGGQREGERKETYTVSLKGADGESTSCAVSESTWRSMKEGSRWSGEVARIGGLRCSSLKPVR